MKAGAAPDFIFGGIPKTKAGIILLVATCGMIHFMKPIIRYITGLFSPVMHKSLMNGLLFPGLRLGLIHNIIL